ncbi:MAG: nucleoside monophosphate kinase [Patescibacteria group bacterium]|nr:nucleoside monophosphate kinase [Patescibacteria group bacterium]
MEFPIFKTKIEGLNQKFDLNDPEERKKYFELKAGKEIRKLREYLKKNTFVAYLLGKKNSGKGTYAKMFAEVVAPEKIVHFSVGDAVRAIDQEFRDPKRKEDLIDFLKRNYRGFMPIEKALNSLAERSTKTLLPTEFILALIKREIAKLGHKALFIDGFPREMDQVSYSLFFRDLIDYRDDPDIFVLIDLPDSIINERIKYRVVCPICQTPRNLKLLPTKEIGYNEKTKEFYLCCDQPTCQKTRMVAKEGDALGIEPIKDRLTKDGKIIAQAFSLFGIPKILLRNSIPVAKAKEYVDDYEITPEYTYIWDEKSSQVKIIEKPWVVLDDQNVPSYSLLPPPVVLSLIKQLVSVLNL